MTATSDPGGAVSQPRLDSDRWSSLRLRADDIDRGRERYQQRVRALASSELAAWAHAGWLGAGDR